MSDMLQQKCWRMHMRRCLVLPTAVRFAEGARRRSPGVSEVSPFIRTTEPPRCRGNKRPNGRGVSTPSPTCFEGTSHRYVEEAQLASRSRYAPTMRTSMDHRERTAPRRCYDRFNLVGRLPRTSPSPQALQRQRPLEREEMMDGSAAANSSRHHASSTMVPFMRAPPERVRQRRGPHAKQPGGVPPPLSQGGCWQEFSPAGEVRARNSDRRG